MSKTIEKLKIGVVGCAGRVGAMVVQEIIATDRHGGNLSLAGGTVKPGHTAEGQDIGTLLGLAPCNIMTSTNPDALFEIADAVIDFTTPEATRQHAALAAKHHTAFITGTTGLTEQDERALQDAAKEAPIVYAANMSIGINLMLALTEQLTASLGPEWDIEIMETHHKHKVDAPSGTALALGKAAAQARGVDFESHAVHERHGHTGERVPSSIGFAVRRGGNMTGQHSVALFGESEYMEITHTAVDRSLFAKGALRAAQWLTDQPNGLYSMRNVLGL